MQSVAEVEVERGKKVRANFRPIISFVLEVRSMRTPPTNSEELRVRYVPFRVLFSDGSYMVKMVGVSFLLHLGGHVLWA